MSKLYYTEPYATQFIAEVVEIIEKNDTFHIVLNHTLFYPGGGGVSCDIGLIEDCPILEVYEENNCIYHVSSKKPIKIHKAKCKIDWQRRFDHMQQHTLQHILSARLSEHFNANTLSFHLGKEICTLDIDTILTTDALASIEATVNQDIINNHPVTELYPTKKELKKLPIKGALPKTDGDLRLVQIEDIDLSACCAIHLRSTLEAQLLRLIKAEKYKGGQRISFVGGTRAIHHLLHTSQTVQGTLDDLTSKNHRLEAEIRSLKQVVADYEAVDMLNQALLHNDVRIIQQVIDGATPKSLQLLGNKLTAHANTIALLGCIADGNCYLAFMCSSDLKTINMSNLLKDTITLIDGRGGGTPTSAQGGGKSVNNLDSALQYALMKVKSTL